MLILGTKNANAQLMDNYTIDIKPSNAVVKVGETFTQTITVTAQEPTNEVFLRYGLWGLTPVPEVEIVSWNVTAPSTKRCTYYTNPGLLECYARNLQTGQQVTFTVVYRALHEVKVRTDFSLSSETASGTEYTGESQTWYIENESIQFNLPTETKWDGIYQTIDVNLVDLMDRQLNNFLFTVTYNGYFADFISLVEQNSLTNGWMFQTNKVYDEETGLMTVVIAASSQGTSITTDGLLIQLTFQVLELPLYSSTFSVVDPLVNGGEYAVKGNSGNVVVQPYKVYGKVMHEPLALEPIVPFPGLTTLLTNTFSIHSTAVTDIQGQYEVTSTSQGFHVITWSIDPIVAHENVSHSDASTILKCSVGKEKCPRNADVNYSRQVDPQDAFLVIEALLGRHHDESTVFELLCDWTNNQLSLNLETSHEVNTFTCGVSGDADISVLANEEVSIASMPNAVFGQQNRNGNLVTIPLTINQIGLDGATVDLDLTNAKLVSSTADGNWNVANNGTRIIVFGGEIADVITVYLTFEVESDGAVHISNLRTLGKTIYQDVAQTPIVGPGPDPIDPMPGLELDTLYFPKLGK